MTKNSFAEALRSLLDETKFLSRAEWAVVVGTNEAEIEKWVSDKIFPSPSKLRMIMDVCENRNVDKAPVEKFKKLYEERLSDISSAAPWGKGPLNYTRNLRLGEYILLPVLDGFLRNLQILPFEIQEKLLFHFAEECREINELKPVSREDGEKALARLAEINGVSVEDMRKRMEKISQDTLTEMNKEESL